MANTTGFVNYDFLGYDLTNNNYSNNVVWTTRSPSNASRVDFSKNIMIPAGMFFIGVFSNVTALIILSVRPSKVSRSTAFYNLVKALAVIDLLGIVALSPVTIAVYIKGGVLNTGGMALCNYFSVGLLTAGTSTLLVVLVMAAERLLVTKYPFHYGVIVTHNRVNIAIGVILLVSLLSALFPVVGFSHNIDHWPGTWCFFNYRSKDVGAYIYSIGYALFGCVVLIVTLILNAAVIQHLWRMRRTRMSTNSVRSSIRTVSATQPKSTESPDSEKRMVIFLMAITIVFTVCYAPLMVRVFMNQIWNAGRDIVSGGVDDALDLWVLRLASLNQLLDPWVYIISRFTCCRAAREKSHSTTMTGSPARIQNGQSTQVNKNVTPINEQKRFGNSLRTVRKLFSSSKNAKTYTDNTMKPLHTELDICSEKSIATVESPLCHTPEKSKCMKSSRSHETEIEEFCP